MSPKDDSVEERGEDEDEDESESSAGDDSSRDTTSEHGGVADGSTSSDSDILPSQV